METNVNPHEAWFILAYMVASFLFIWALKGLSSPATARRGNLLGMLGMAIAIGATLVQVILNPNFEMSSLGIILAGIVVGGTIGTIIALRIQMTDMPQLVAALHSFVGLAAVLVAAAAYYMPEAFGILDEFGKIKVLSRVEMSLGNVIGGITFTGSVVAFTKLQGLVSGNPVTFKGQHFLNLMIALAMIAFGVWFGITLEPLPFWLMTAMGLILGVTNIIPIGGADMPVVISVLNSSSGFAAAGIGFTLHNPLLIVTGACVGSSGAILSYIMCKAMNRSLINVLLGGFGSEGGTAAASTSTAGKRANVGSIEDAAFLLENASTIIIVPGYGMAVSQAHHAVREMAEMLIAKGASVKYAIHPVAGRMPGHMNVLLADANVPYDQVFEMDEVNNDFPNCDVAFVMGANDITNPAAEKDPSSPIAGMPILQVYRAKTCIFCKRSLGGVGYAGIDNDLFYQQNTMMLLGDAKKTAEELNRALKGGH